MKEFFQSIVCTIFIYIVLVITGLIVIFFEVYDSGNRKPKWVDSITDFISFIQNKIRGVE